MTTTAPSLSAAAARRAARRSAGSIRRASTAAQYVVMIVLAPLFLAPILFMLVSSFRSDPAIFESLQSGLDAFLPVGPLTLDNYAQVFDAVPVGRFLLNSLFVSLTTVALGLVVNSMLGFALARMRWGARSAVFGLIIATLILPFDSIAIPLLYEVTKLPKITFEGGVPRLSVNWLNTYYVQIVPFVANAFSVFLFRQFFSLIPPELDEAARVDGASWWRIYRSIGVPLAGPAFGTAAILTFLPAWNQYLWPLIAVQSEQLRPLNVGMDYFFQLKAAWGQVMAYGSIVVMPVVVVFLIFQRSFVNSIAATGVKG